MLGASPDPETDEYLGDAVNSGGGVYSFPLPPYSFDYTFYYHAVDAAGNNTVSNTGQYWNGQNALLLRGYGDNQALWLSQGGVLNLRT